MITTPGPTSMRGSARLHNPSPSITKEQAQKAVEEIAFETDGGFKVTDEGIYDIIRDLVLEFGLDIVDIHPVQLPHRYGRPVPLSEVTADRWRSLIQTGLWRVVYNSKERQKHEQHVAQRGKDWGPDGENAFVAEHEVRTALIESAEQVGRAVVDHPLSVRSSYSPLGRVTKWVDPSWRAVLVFTESGIGDPMDDRFVYQAFERTAQAIGEGWAWDSISAGVQEFRFSGTESFAAGGIPVSQRRGHQRRRRIPLPPRDNPGVDQPHTEDTKRAAIQKYQEFWRLEPTKVADFPSSFTIPAKVKKLGKAVNVLYESGKVDPETMKKPRRPLSYIHEHDAGVHVYDLTGTDTEVPEFVHKAPALVLLGACLGFAWKDDDEEHEAEGSHPLPDLYCTVDGRALLVIQSRRKLLALIWGGSLGVEARGIVG